MNLISKPTIYKDKNFTEISRNYEVPNAAILKKTQKKNIKIRNSEANQQNINVLNNVFSHFGINGNITEFMKGSIVDTYILKIKADTNINRVIALSHEISSYIGNSSLRILKTINPLILHIEIPNGNIDLPDIRETLLSKKYKNNKNFPLIFGKSSTDTFEFMKLNSISNMFITGSNERDRLGSIHSILFSFIYNTYPDEINLIILDSIDSKLKDFEKLPHMLSPILLTKARIKNIIDFASTETLKRLNIIDKLSITSIKNYNDIIEKAKRSGEILYKKLLTGFDDFGDPIFNEKNITMKKIPKLVIIINDCCGKTLDKKEIKKIEFITKMSYQAGIHLIFSDNFNDNPYFYKLLSYSDAIITHKLNSINESSKLMKKTGAESLTCREDILFYRNNCEAKRFHLPKITINDISKTMNWIKNKVD